MIPLLYIVLTSDKEKNTEEKETSSQSMSGKSRIVDEVISVIEKRKRDTVQNALNDKEKASDKTDKSKEYRYSIKFKPRIGMKTRTKTTIHIKLYSNNRLVKKKYGTVLQEEKIIEVSDDDFRTEKRVTRKSDLVDNMNIYNPMDPNERAIVRYDKSGLVKDYVFFGPRKIIIPQKRYLFFVYPKRPVGVGEKWGGDPGKTVEESDVYYYIDGFKLYKGREVVVVKLKSTKITPFYNISKLNYSNAGFGGSFYLDVINGSILFFEVNLVFSCRNIKNQLIDSSVIFASY